MTARTLSASAALLAVLVACTGRGGSGAEATASLRIIVRDAASAPPQTASLTCGEAPAGVGFLADKAKAAAACDAITRNGAAAKLLLDGPATDRVCTMVYGGPQVARVTGTLRGRIVDWTFKRTNGCEIADWNSLVVLLGEPRGGPAGAPQ